MVVNYVTLDIVVTCAMIQELKKKAGPSESVVQNLVRGVFCRNGAPTRLWRNVVGMFFRLPANAKCAKCGVSHEQGRNIVGCSRVTCGLGNGSADLVGLQQVTITPDMVGQTLAIFFGAEIKRLTGRASQEQDAWLETIRRLGGAAGIFRSESEAEKYLEELATWRPSPNQ